MTERMKMALFDALTTPGTVYRRMPHGDHGPVGPNDDHTKELLAAHRVWVDESLHQRLDLAPRTVDFVNDFGLLRLPYPNMWFEWYDQSAQMQVAMHCLEIPQMTGARDNDPTCTYAWMAFPYMFPPDDFPIREFAHMPTMYDQLLEFDFDDLELLGVRGLRWKKDTFEIMNLGVDENHKARMDANQDANDLGAVVELMWNGLVALGFMNCRNVSTQRVERPAKQPKKSRRKRPDRADYHVIVLPRKAYSGDSYTTDEHGRRRLHCVRGHVKTFTAERPLLGKHVGSYWWSDQLRGNPDLGVVEADYKVAN